MKTILKKTTEGSLILLCAPATLLSLIYIFRFYTILARWINIEDTQDIKIFSLFGLLISLFFISFLIYDYFEDEMLISCDRCGESISKENNSLHYLAKKEGEKSFDLCSDCKHKVTL